MKIAIFSGGYPPLESGKGDGGADHVQRLAENLAMRGHEVHVLTSVRRPHEAAAGAGSLAGLFIHRMVSEWGLRGLWKGEFDKVRRKLSEMAPDVVIVLNPDGVLGGSRCALPLMVRFIFPDAPLVARVLHFMHPRLRWHPVYLAQLFVFYSSCARLCFQEPRHRAIFQRLFPFLRHRCVFISGGCNVMFTQEYSLLASRQARERLGLSPDYRYVSFYGFWYPSKNVHLLVEAVARLIQRGVKLKLLLIGGLDKQYLTDSYSRRVLRLIDELRLWPFVVQTGYCTEERLSDYLLGSEVCVHPYGNRVIARGTLFETMTLGVPLVTTRPAESEFLQDRRNAILIDAPSVEAIETAIMQLLEDDELRARVSHGARETAQEVSWPRLIRRWESLLEEVIASGVEPR